MQNYFQSCSGKYHGIRAAVSIVVCSLVIIAIPSQADGQCVEGCQVIYVLTGEAPGDQFGWESPSLGDIDQDGFNDFVITAPTNDAGGNNAGRAYVYSGASGDLLFRVTGSTASAQLGFNSNRAGDVGAADGIPDLILGAPFVGTGQAFIHSGAGGALIHTFNGVANGDEFGYRVSGDVDIDGDGRSDLLVGAPNHDTAGNNSGRVYAYSGVDFSLICTIDGVSAGDRFGTALNGVGDLNNDLREEFVVGAEQAGAGSVGRAYVITYNGVSCSTMFTLAPTSAAFDFGLFFAGGGGDVNNDGTPDVYVGDFSANRAYVYSGADGTPLLTLSGDNNGGFGIGEIIGDVNGDGHSDLILAAWVSNNGGSGAGKAFVYSGADGTILETFTHNVPGANFGFDAKRLGDINSDGKIDHLVTAATDFNARGKAYVIAGTVSSMPEVRLLVTGWSSNNVVAYDAGAGSGIGTFIAAGVGGLGSPHSIRKGPDGKYYVTSVATNRVLRFNASDGSFDTVFVNPAGTPLNAPTDAVFGPDGNLYVASFNNSLVLRFNGQTGAFIDTFATGGPGGGRTEMLEWGTDGHLYVTTGQGHSVIRFDGVTGLPLPGPLGTAGTAEFVPAGSGNLNDPHSLIFGPDGNLYVSSMGNPRVVKFDGATGTLLDVLAVDDPGTEVDESGGLSQPHGMSFGPDGDLFVCSFGSNNVLRFDTITGDFIEVFAAGSGLLQPIHLLFEVSPADFDKDFDVDQDDANVMIGCFNGPGNEVSSLCRVADFDQDTDVDCGDWENFKRAWIGSPTLPPLLASCVTAPDPVNPHSYSPGSLACGGGDNYGLPCQTCTGGSRDTLLCLDSSNCTGGGTCDPDGTRCPGATCGGTIAGSGTVTYPWPGSRFIGFSSNTTWVNKEIAIRVNMVNVDGFPACNGKNFWAGPPAQFCEGSACSTMFWASELQTTPHWMDWTTVGEIQIHGEQVIPGSRYAIQAIDRAFETALDFESNYSLPAMLVDTAQWGDAGIPMAGFTSASQPSISDVLTLVDKWLGGLEPRRSRSQLNPGLLNLNTPVGIADVLRGVDAWLGSPYPFTITTCTP